MESMPSLEDVRQAIHILYHDPDTSQKEKASAWLGELQRSMFAWTIADELLKRNDDVESCYFSAQTMRTKIQYAFHELPQGSHQLLRDSLIQHLSNTVPETNSVIVTQLCLALADLALQMASWKMSTRDLIERMSSNAQLIPALLEIITVLPEEVNSRSLRLGANRRDEVMEEFHRVAPNVLQLLVAYTESVAITDPRLQAKILKCLGSWLSIGAMPTAEVAHSKLLLSILCSLSNPGTPSMVHEAACDCICAALVLIEDREKHAELTQALFQGVHALTEAYHLSVAEEDIDKSINYCRIFTELAESLLEVIIETPGQGLGSLQTLDAVLMCVGNHDYEMAEITFNFWYRLSEILYKKNNDQLNSIFKPYIERLITALCRQCQMEPDLDGIPDEGDDFADFRIRVSELIKDVVFIVGSSNCFQQMFNNLKNQENNAAWDVVEASLFVMSAVAKNIIPEENEVVPQVIHAIINIPDNVQIHVAVRFTSIQLIGEFREWIEKHPQSLEPVLNFLVKCLKEPTLATVAANALQNICAACTDQMGFHFNGLLEIIRGMSMESFNVSNEAAVGLLKGTALTLCKMPVEKISEGVMQLCQIQTGPLSQVLNDDGLSNDKKKIDPAIWLDRLAAIFRHFHLTITNGQTHPCKGVIQEIWPILSQTCIKFQHDVRIIERCCRCIRFMVRCVGRQSAPLLEPLVKQIVQLYQIHQHSCYLYLGSILVDEYGMDQGCHKGLLEMLEAFCGPTFRLLDGPNNLRNHPDTVDDLFRLCTRFLQRITVLFLQSSMFKSILQCGLVACALDHRDANASVMKFFNELIRCRRIKDEAEDFEIRRTLVDMCLAEHGAMLISNLVEASLFCLPTFMIPDVADVIYELMGYNRLNVCVWLEETLKTLPTQSSGGSITATQKQLTDFHKAVTSAESGREVSLAMKALLRLYR